MLHKAEPKSQLSASDNASFLTSVHLVDKNALFFIFISVSSVRQNSWLYKTSHEKEDTIKSDGKKCFLSL